MDKIALSSQQKRDKIENIQQRKEERERKKRAKIKAAAHNRPSKEVKGKQVNDNDATEDKTGTVVIENENANFRRSSRPVKKSILTQNCSMVITVAAVAVMKAEAVMTKKLVCKYVCMYILI